MAAELYAWAPVLADWLLRFYVRFLPEEIGERLLEEWQALLYDTPGNISKLLVALSIGRTIVSTKKEAEDLLKTRVSVASVMMAALIVVFYIGAGRNLAHAISISLDNTTFHIHGNDTKDPPD
ncbi:MAG: hypothetical protein AAF810_25240 [Cyanobacteria bacterium P01_D01_bin.36]